MLLPSSMDNLYSAMTFLDPRIFSKLAVQWFVDLRANRVANELLKLVGQGAHDSSNIRIAALENIRSAREYGLEDEAFEIVTL